jgi:hypothetical protein
VWNLMAGELWRRTTIAINRYIRRLARSAASRRARRVTGTGRVRWVCPVRLSFGKAAEMQRRAVVHFHAIIRLDGYDPDHPTPSCRPRRSWTPPTLVAAVDHAARTVAFTTEPHPAGPAGGGSAGVSRCSPR